MSPLPQYEFGSALPVRFITSEHNKLECRFPYVVPTIVFKRYERLEFRRTTSELLANSLVGEGDVVAINDSWVLNLKTTGVEMNNYCDMLNDKTEQLRKMWQNGDAAAIDVGDELKDLLKVYLDAEENLKTREVNNLETMTHYMKKYLESKEERVKITVKLQSLMDKMKKVNNEADSE